MTDPARLKQQESALASSLGAKETTSLTPEEEATFQAWAKKNRIHDVDHPDSFYDYRGYWKQYGNEPHQHGTHFTDEFKQHGHPTFSVESNYSKMPGDGGSWVGEKYTPTDYVDPAEYQGGVQPAPRAQVIKKPAADMSELDSAYGDERKKKARS